MLSARELVADVSARVVGWYTTTEMQQIPKPLVTLMKKTRTAKKLKNRYEVETFTTRSFDGVELAGTVFHAVDGCHWDGKKHVALLIHGFQVQQVTVWPCLPLFLPNGYDCVTIDLRASGLSGKAKCTMGWNEAEDVAAACRWIRDRYGEDVVLGIYGQSMGSASIMQYAWKDPSLGFLVEDCGYADLNDTVRELVTRVAPFLDADLFLEKVQKYATVDGITYSDVRPIEAVAKLSPDVPVLFLHGIPDQYIVCENVDRLYEARQGKKELHKYPDAGHAASILTHPVRYYRDVENFLRNNELLPPRTEEHDGNQ